MTDPADPADRLSALRDGTGRHIAALQAELDDVRDSASSTTGDDEHDPEGTTIGFERAQAQALLDSARSQLAEIESALDRVADGSYGVCARCGRPIGAERLEARPSALRCIACASLR